MQGKIILVVHRLLPCYCECSFLTPWCSLQGRGALSISLAHLTTFLLHPILSLSFSPLLHPAGFVPATVCQEVDWTLLLKWPKLKGTPFLMVIYTPDGCSRTAPSSSYQAMPGRKSGSGWMGTSLVALPCRRLSFVELLLPDRGLSKELQCNKSRGSQEDWLNEALKRWWCRVRKWEYRWKLGYENSVHPDKAGSAVRMKIGLEEALLGREKAEHQIK